MSTPSPLVRMRQPAPLMLVLASAAIAVAAYLQALDYPFISDDRIYITDNAKLAGLHLAELWRLFTEPYNTSFEFLPLRDFSYWLDIKLFGQNPFASRMHNIFLYVFCLPLVYGATLGLWRYFRPADASASWAAAVVTSLFALHPALVESVVWISGRKYILPNLFSMLALWFAVNARREHGLSTPYAAAALIAFAAVMLSKASYVAVAPVIALVWLLFWRDVAAPKQRRSQLLWPLAILILAALMMLVFIVSNKGFDRLPFYFGIEAVTRTLAVLGWLARLAVSPESRHFFYPVFEDTHLPAMISLGVAVLAAAVTGWVMMLRKRSLEGFALVVFFLLCIPYIHLIPHRPPSLVSDRYVALAVWPAVLLLVALSWRLKPAPRAVLLLAIALLWGFQTIERPRDWRTLETLIDRDLRAFPGSYMPAEFKIMFVLLPQGLTREASEIANSITVPECRNIMVVMVKAEHALADAVATGKPREAMTLLLKLFLDLKQPPVQSKWDSPINNFWGNGTHLFENQWSYLIEQFPNDESVRYNTGLMMLDFHRNKDAAVHLRAAIDSQRLPESVRGTAFRSLGIALLRSGQVAEAEAPLRAALEQAQPDLRAYCLLSSVYKQTKRLEEAARAEAECRKQAPGEGMAQ